MSLLAKQSSTGSMTVQKKFTVEKSPTQIVVEFEEGFGLEDFKQAIRMMLDLREEERWSYKKPICYYREPSIVYYRGKNHRVSEFACDFFFSGESLAYTPTGRTGWFVPDMSYGSIKRIVLYHIAHPLVLSDKEAKQEKLWKKVQKARFDDNTWSGLTKDQFREASHPFYNITKLLSIYDQRKIQQAFEEKKHFSFSVNKTKRCYTFEGKVGDDGIYRAWFSSEEIGESHGSYYFLLNPTNAVFIEHD